MLVKYLEELLQSMIEDHKLQEKKLLKIQRSFEDKEKIIISLRNQYQTDFLSPQMNIPEQVRCQIEENEKQQKAILDLFEAQEIEIRNTEVKIDELKSVLKIAKNNQEARDKLVHRKRIDEHDIYRLKILEIQEMERQRIARELHDSSVQSITGLIYKTELCSKLIDIDPIRCRMELIRISNTMQEVIDEMRQMIYDLRPMSFDDIGFEISLEKIISKIVDGTTIKADLKVVGNPCTVNPIIAITIVRIIQEACNNAVKYAECKQIKANIEYRDKKLFIEISDDGKGFDVGQELELKDDNSGFGLSSMRERVYLLSGEIKIQSEMSRGTKIFIQIPICEEELANVD
ncbi:MAG: sensor histidine kinase [Lachnospiraceae bacterium]